MAAGDSIVGTCNLALIAIGDDPIASLSDQRKAAILCTSLYDNSRREVLRLHPWKFAKAQAYLAASTTAPLLTYANAYPLPADFIRMFDAPDFDQPEYEIQGSMLLSDDGPPYGILYVFDNQDPATFDPLFVHALATYLAAKLAQPLAQSMTRQQQLMAEFKDILADARLIDSQEQTSVEEDDDIWLRARR